MLDLVIYRRPSGLERQPMHPTGQHILVADHDPVRREQVKRVLIDEGFQVATAGEGLAAIRNARGQRFALIVAALGLPGTLDGPATAQQLRSRQPWLKALFTADAGERLHGPVRDCGDVVPWPCPPGELLGCVFEMLQRDRLGGAPSSGAAYRVC
jgi:CheY-like chemotaxis protein